MKRWPFGGREVGSKSDILLSLRSASTISIWQSWCECALHGSIHPQLCCIAKRILSRFSFGQLLRLTGARVCLLFQTVRRQEYGLVPVTHAGPHFGECKLLSNHSRGSDCDGPDITCVCWMWPQRVQRSVQCSYPAREGVMRCTTLTARQRSQEFDRNRDGEDAI